MCGRFSLTQRLEILERIFRAKARERLHERAKYNIAPTQPILAICQDSADEIQELTWGMETAVRDDAAPRIVVNAVGETLAHRPLFAEALQARRCLVLADGFFEWETRAGKRYPRYFRLKSGEPFAFAGLYQESPGEDPPRRGVIITTEANELVAPVHERMPVMLQDGSRWLKDGDQSVIAPFPPAQMQAYNVNPVVNSSEHDTPKCIEPYEPKEIPLF